MIYLIIYLYIVLFIEKYVKRRMNEKLNKQLITNLIVELCGEQRYEKPLRSNSMLRITEHKCTACRGEMKAEFEWRRKDSRLIRSADFALGLEKKREPTMGDDVPCRNGLPPMKMTVPRPRTPFARRTFCIDTLAPPFSVVNGCRDADYPEHWRLMSVYQQSYKNPQKRKARRF